METESRHLCFIYDGPPSRHLSVIAEVIQQKLDQGFRCLYLNNPPMVAGIRSYLSTTGLDVAAEIEKTRLILSSKSTCADDGSFNIDMMLTQLEAALDQALQDGYKGLFATGDMTWELGAEKNFEKLMEYEYRLEEFFEKNPWMHGICQYHRDTLSKDVARLGFLTHRSILIDQALSRGNPYYVPSALADEQMQKNQELDNKIDAFCKQSRDSDIP